MPEVAETPPVIVNNSISSLRASYKNKSTRNVKSTGEPQPSGKPNVESDQKRAELSPLGTSIEQTLSISPDKVHPDIEFAVIAFQDKPNVAELALQFAKQVVDNRAIDIVPEIQHRHEATKYLGRGTLTELPEAWVTTDGLRTIAWTTTKSTGVPRVVRDSWPDYRGQLSPFFHHVPTEPHRDQRTDLVKREAFLGLGSHLQDRQRKDAINSLLLHQLGIKTRLPIAGWQVDGFQVWDENAKELIDRDIRWFKTQGFDGNDFEQSEWGVSCPLRFEDVNDLLSRFVLEPETINFHSLNGFLDQMFALAEKDISPEYISLTEKWAARRQEGQELSQVEVVQALEDFGIALCQTMGRNYDRAYAGDSQARRYTHGVLHDQNIYFFGEWADNFTVKEGLLEIGLAPENSGDIDGFRLGLHKYARIILQLRKSTDLGGRSQDVYQYTDEVFHKAVRSSWTSYKQYCNERYEQDLIEYKRLKKTEIEENIMSDGVPITEQSIDIEARLKFHQYIFGSPETHPTEEK